MTLPLGLPVLFPSCFKTVANSATPPTPQKDQGAASQALFSFRLGYNIVYPGLSSSLSNPLHCRGCRFQNQLLARSSHFDPSLLFFLCLTFCTVRGRTKNPPCFSKSFLRHYLLFSSKAQARGWRAGSVLGTHLLLLQRTRVPF